MATVTQGLQSGTLGVGKKETPWETRLRMGRYGLSILFLIMAGVMLITNGQNYLTVIFFLWLAVCAVWLRHGIMIGYCVLTIYPVTRALTIALRPAGNLLNTSLAIIPPDATLANFTKLFSSDPNATTQFVLWLWNSLIISVSVALVGLVVSATGAYAFSRFRFPGRAPGLLALLTTQMIPAGMMLIPIFVIVNRYHLKDNILGLIVAYTATAVPFSIWMLKGYFDTIPIDLEEAALVDGASRMEAFVRMILPISTPALMTVFLWNFTSAWSEWQVAAIILQNPNSYTWPIGLKNLIGQFATDWGTYAAASLLVSLPVMILFLYSSRYVISGLTLGSVKG
jgi:arabinogalactan oligomer / maltooligosaccharide transport system permease protein